MIFLIEININSDIRLDQIRVDKQNTVILRKMYKVMDVATGIDLRINQNNIFYITKIYNSFKQLF